MILVHGVAFLVRWEAAERAERMVGGAMADVV